MDRYFEDNVYPVLTPMAMDSSRPFPLIRNKTLNIGALIAKKNNKKHTKELEFATVQVPSVLPSNRGNSCYQKRRAYSDSSGGDY